MKIGRRQIEETKKNIKKARIVRNKEKARHKSVESLKSGVRRVVAGVTFTALTAGFAPKASMSNVNTSSDSFSNKEGKNIVTAPQEDVDEATLVLTAEDFKKQLPELGDEKGKEKKSKKEITDSLEMERLMREIDSLDNVCRENIALTGYNVSYHKLRNGSHDKWEDCWIIDTENDYMVLEGPLNYDEIAKKYKEENKKIFSEPVKYVSETRGLDYFCSQAESINPVYGEYSHEDNTITIYQYSLKGKKKLVDEIMKVRNYPREKADSLVMTIYDESHDSDWIASCKEHEKAHYSDCLKGLMIPNLPGYHMNHLDCMTEIHGTMAQAAFALEQYEKDGKLSHFAPVNLEVDTLDLQRQLLKESNPEKRKKLVGKYIFDKWLDTWNVEGSAYSNGIVASRVPVVYYLDPNNLEFRKEYLRRANEMFADVGYLGDMRDVINPDFELNPQLQVEKKAFINDITQNSSTVAEAYDRIARILTVVRDCDADAVRTKEEQDFINQVILDMKAEAKKIREGNQENQSSHSTVIQRKSPER